MGVTIPPKLVVNLIINTFIVSNFNYFLISKNYLTNFSEQFKNKKRPAICRSFSVCKISKLNLDLEAE